MSGTGHVIFHRKGDGWQGWLDGQSLRFDNMQAGDVYELMLKRYPQARVGFVSGDIGCMVAIMAGPVLWMKTAEERAA